jgi:S1-C subfamily serine protease
MTMVTNTRFYDMGQIASNTQFEMTFVNTANNGIYLMENYYKNSHTTAKAIAILTGNGILEFSYDLPTAELKKRLTTWIEGTKGIFEHQWIKTFPTKSDYEKSSPASGTGFGISSNGIIVTNFHVIDGAKNIKVRGVNSDYSTTYNARVIVSDKNNDLAVIQIDDYILLPLAQFLTLLKQTLPELVKASLY